MKKYKVRENSLMAKLIKVKEFILDLRVVDVLDVVVAMIVVWAIFFVPIALASAIEYSILGV